MEILVRRTQEFRKGRLLSSDKWRLTLEVTTELSDHEQALVQKYGNPSIHAIPAEMTASPSMIRSYYDGSDEAYREIKVDDGVMDTPVSGYQLVAHVDDGARFIGNIEEFEQATVKALSNAISRLRSLERWDQNFTISTDDD